MTIIRRNLEKYIRRMPKKLDNCCILDKIQLRRERFFVLMERGQLNGRKRNAGESVGGETAAHY